MELKELFMIIKNATYKNHYGYEYDCVSKDGIDKLEKVITDWYLKTDTYSLKQENEILKAKIFAYEEIIKKSNFEPFVIKELKEGE